LTVPVTGIYQVHGWSNVLSSINNVVVGVKYALNGVVIPSAAAPTVRRKVAAGSDLGVISAGGLISLTANDVISLHIACDKTANITIPDAGLSLVLVKA